MPTWTVPPDQGQKQASSGRGCPHPQVLLEGQPTSVPWDVEEPESLVLGPPNCTNAYCSPAASPGYLLLKKTLAMSVTSYSVS